MHALKFRRKSLERFSRSLAGRETLFVGEADGEIIGTGIVIGTAGCCDTGSGGASVEELASGCVEVAGGSEESVRGGVSRASTTAIGVVDLDRLGAISTGCGDAGLESAVSDPTGVGGEDFSVWRIGAEGTVLTLEG